jgi:hypothetical protein
VVLITAGISNGLAAVFLDRTKKYTLLLKFVCIAGSLCCFFGAATLEYYPVFMGFCVIAGLVVSPILLLSFSLSAELTYPVNPPIPNGILMSSALLWATVMTLSAGKL